VSAAPSSWPEPLIEWPPIALRVRVAPGGDKRTGASIVVEGLDDGAALWIRSNGDLFREVLRQMGKKTKGLPISRLGEFREPFVRALGRVFPGVAFDVTVDTRR
jgi:hypothetical protein